MYRAVRNVSGVAAASILLTFAATVTSAAEVFSSPDGVLAAIKQRGASAVVEELWRSGSWQRYVYPGVSSGDPKWLEVARVLRPATDAGASEELFDALALALQRRPYLALPVVKEAWWPGGQPLCAFGWDDELPGGVLVYVGKLESALKSPAPPELVAMRKECLAGLVETRKRVKGARK
jgi:hypothetical protein